MASQLLAGVPFLPGLTMGLVAIAVMLASSRRIDRAIKLISLQAIVMAILVGLMGYAERDWHVYVVAGVVLLVKGVAAPGILLRVLRRAGSKLEVEMFVGRTTSLVLASGLVLLAYYVTRPFAQTGIARDLLSISLALILIGLLMMVTRKTALMQVMGFLLLENGVFLTAVSTTLGMPMVVEMGIFLDMLVGVGIMALLSQRINDKFDSMEITKLNSLKG